MYHLLLSSVLRNKEHAGEDHPFLSGIFGGEVTVMETWRNSKSSREIVISTQRTKHKTLLVGDCGSSETIS